jgi:hypothetical protein
LHHSRPGLVTPWSNLCWRVSGGTELLVSGQPSADTSEKHIRHPTFVFFGDISLAFPSVFREQLLLRLHALGIPNNIWQHLRALHHSIRVCVDHGHSAPTSYINILQGLTEGGRLCPLLWGLYIADLVTTLQRSFPNITLPPPDITYFIAILLYVDDFALLASSRVQLLALMQLTQTWCENNHLLLAYEKYKVIVFHENPFLRRQRAGLPWTITSPFPSPSVQIVKEVDTFNTSVQPFDRRVTLDQFCTLILQRIWHAHHKLAVARGCPRSPLHNGPATTIYNLWRASVAVHALMHLVSLLAPHHLADTFRTLLEVVGRVQRD